MSADGSPPPDQQVSSASAFWWRLTDNLFRRWFLFLIPIVLFAGLGAYQSTKTIELYRADGRLNVTSNPLVEDAVIGGAPAQFWETPADVTARTLDEQLLTDSFVEKIADRAELTPAIESGFLDLGVVRSSVWTSTSGSSLVTVSASWALPETSLALVEATIAGYQEFISETVASDAREAVEFYGEQLVEQVAEVEVAQAALTDFVVQLPELEDGEEMDLITRLQLDRLTNELKAAEDKVAATEAEIEGAELNVRTAESDAGESLNVIDAPMLPTAPESTFIDRLTTIISYAVLGMVVAVSALLVSTVLDRSIVSERDLASLAGVSFVAAVPVIRHLDGQAGSGRRGRRGGRGRRSGRGTRSGRSEGGGRSSDDAPVDAEADTETPAERAGV